MPVAASKATPARATASAGKAAKATPSTASRTAKPAAASTSSASASRSANASTSSTASRRAVTTAATASSSRAAATPSAPRAPTAASSSYTTKQTRPIADLIELVKDAKRCDAALPHDLLSALGTTSAHLALDLDSRSREAPKSSSQAATSTATDWTPSPRDVYHCKHIVNNALKALAELNAAAWKASEAAAAPSSASARPDSRAPRTSRTPAPSTAKAMAKPASGSASSQSSSSAASVTLVQVHSLTDAFRIAMAVVSFSSSSKEGEAKMPETAKELQMESCSLTFVKRLIAMDLHRRASQEVQSLRERIIRLLSSSQAGAGSDATQPSFLLPAPLSSLSAPFASFLLDLQAQAAACVFAKADTDEVASLVSSLLDDASGPLAWQFLARSSSASDLTSHDRSAYVLERVLTRALIRLGGAKEYLASWALSLRHASASLLLFPLDLDVDAFWERMGKVGVCHVREAKSGSVEARLAFARVDGMNQRLVDLAQRVEATRAGDGDQTRAAKIREGKGFVSFCDRWLALAKNAGEEKAVDRVLGLMLTEQVGFGDSSEEVEDSTPSQDARPASPNKKKAPSPPPLDADSAAKALRRGEARLTKSSMALDKLIKGDEAQGEVDVEATLTEAVFVVREMQAPLSACVDAEIPKTSKALDQLRRRALKALDDVGKGRNDSGKAHTHAIEALLLVILDRLEQLLHRPRQDSETTTSGVPTPSDLVYDIIQSLRLVANAKFQASEADTHEPVLHLLQRCVALIDDGANSASLLPLVARAENAHFLSTSYHNYSAQVYKTGKTGWCLPFLEAACRTAAKAEELYAALDHADEKDEPGERRSQEATIQAIDCALRLHEHWGHCARKVGHNETAAKAFAAFITLLRPEHWDPLVEALKARSSVNEAFSDSNSETVQFGKVVACAKQALELDTFTRLRSTADEEHIVALLGRSNLPAPVVGGVLEHCAVCLENVAHREEAGDAKLGVLSACLDVYPAELYPLRRARVVLRMLELGILQPSAALPITALEALVQEARTLLTSDHGEDSGLAQQRPYLEASLELLCVLLEQARSSREGSKRVKLQASKAADRLRGVLAPHAADVAPAHSSSPAASTAQGSPTPAAARRTPRTTGRVLRAATSVKANASPVTPPRRTRKMDSPGAFKTRAAVSRAGDVVAPARLSGIAISADEVERLFSLTQLVQGMVNSFGHTLASVQLLKILRLLTLENVESLPSTAIEVHCSASAALARHYLELGNIGRAEAVLDLAVSKIDAMPTSISIDTRYRCLLVKAELQSRQGLTDEAMRTHDAAVELVEDLSPPTAVPSWQIALGRSAQYERHAMAADVFAKIRLAQGDLVAALSAGMASLRLASKAANVLARITSPSDKGKSRATSEERSVFVGKPAAEVIPSSDPVLDSSVLGREDASPLADDEERRRSMPRLSTATIAVSHWRLVKTVLKSFLSMSRLFSVCGLGRDAECFATEAISMSTSMHLPFSSAQALIQRAELRLHLGRRAEGEEDLAKGLQLLDDEWIPEALHLTTIKGDAHAKLKAFDEALGAYTMGKETLGTLARALEELEGVTAFPPRHGVSPRKLHGGASTLLPDLAHRLALREAWLLQAVGKVEESQALLDALGADGKDDWVDAGEASAEKALWRGHILSRKGVDALHGDQVLSLLDEAAVSLPMVRCSGSAKLKLAGGAPAKTAAQSALTEAEAAYSRALSLQAQGSNFAVQVREALKGLAAVQLLQALLGKQGDKARASVGALLSSCASVTLQREMLRAIDLKLRPKLVDDLVWLTFEPKPKRVVATTKRIKPAGKAHAKYDMDEEDATSSSSDGEAEGNKSELDRFWLRSRERQMTELAAIAGGEDVKPVNLPRHWTAISITASRDGKSLVVSRQGGGREHLLFALPIDRQSRREGEEEELTLEAAQRELHDIVETSNSATSSAKDLQGEGMMDKRKAWWTARRALDTRLKTLLEAMEQRWLGPFKGLFMEPVSAPSDILDSFRSSFDDIIRRSCFARADARRSLKLKLHDGIFECFAALPATTSDEELEDLLHYVMDAFQFNGVPVAIDEVDLDQAVTDLRGALEAFRSRAAAAAAAAAATSANGSANAKDKDEHFFLILDKETSPFPWESIPCLRRRAVSRIPSLTFLQDRIELARTTSRLHGGSGARLDGSFQLDARRAKTFYLVNPSQDLIRTQERFEPWLRSKTDSGLPWSGIAGRAPLCDEFLDALASSDLVLYFGHSGAEQYAKAQRIKSLPRCAVTMLWGCSSGVLKDQGEFDRQGTPNNYMLAGCPALVGNLWDATDRELDGICEAVLDAVGLKPMEEGGQARGGKREAKGTGGRRDTKDMSLTRAVNESRDACKLPYLSGAAVVVYGVPVYM